MFVSDLIDDIFKGLVNLAKTTSVFKCEFINDNKCDTTFAGILIKHLRKNTAI